MFKKSKNLLRTSRSIYGLRALNYVNEMWRNDWQNDALSGWKFVLFSKWRECNRIFTRRSKPESRSRSLLLHGTMCRTTDGVMLKLWTKVFKPALNWAPADWKIPKIVASRRLALLCAPKNCLQDSNENTVPDNHKVFFRKIQLGPQVSVGTSW